MASAEQQLQLISSTLPQQSAVPLPPSADNIVELDIDHRENQLSPESIIDSAPTETPLPAEASLSCPGKSLHKRKLQAPKCARVLTSAELLPYLEERQRKKKEEQEQKEQRKKERTRNKENYRNSKRRLLKAWRRQRKKTSCTSRGKGSVTSGRLLKLSNTRGKENYVNCYNMPTNREPKGKCLHNFSVNVCKGLQNAVPIYIIAWRRHIATWTQKKIYNTESHRNCMS